MDETLNVITIDGPAGVGKTTLARTLAAKIKIAFLDTGAMFRAIALHLGPGSEKFAHNVLESKVKDLNFSLQGFGEKTQLFCNNRPLGLEIRTETVAMTASKLAQIGLIREFLATAQRKIASQSPLVAEGRDMSTVIFPTARCKFFLDASPEIRANRRLNDPHNQEKTDLATLIAQIKERDALVIDTSNLTIDAVLKIMEDEIRAKGGFNGQN